MLKHLFLLIFATLVVGMTGCSHVASQPKGGADASDSAAMARRARLLQARAKADSLVETLSLSRQIGQLMFPRLDVTDNAEGRAVMRRMVERYGIGGFLLGKGTLADYKGIIDYAQSISPIPLMVTLDGEWGLAMRVTDAPRFPHNMALGAVADPTLMEAYGREIARECREMGINVDFAPVLDVNSNPANPVIGYRSFGEDPQRVAALGVAYSRGLEEGGVMSVAKHFPGHGDTSADSHKTLPTVTHSKKELERIDLVPFDSYIKAGLSGVMVGHLNVPALDASGAPASLSQVVTTDLLRGKMGFDGLVWTDALAMKGAATGGSNCVAALMAGADVLLQPASLQADLLAVEKAVADGRIPAETIRERCVKVLTYKYLFPSVENGDPDALARVRGNEADAVNRLLCDAVITLLHNGDDMLPLTGLQERDIAVVSLGAKSANPFSEMMAKYASCKTFGSPEGALTDSQLAAIGRCNTVVIGVFKQSNAVAQSIGRLAALKGQCAATCFINPYKMARMQSALSKVTALVAAFDDTPALEQSAAEGIFGGIAMTGRLPVNLQGWYKIGTGISTEKTRLGFSTPAAQGLPANLRQTYAKIIGNAIADGAFPGCQVVVAKNGYIVLDKAYGTLNPRGSVPVTDKTLYDVASVTKVAATTSALMQAYDRGLFQLTDPVSRFIPELRGKPLGDVTMRDLLLHRSGLPAGLSMLKVMVDTTSYSGPLTRARQCAPYTVRLEKNLYVNSNARLRRDITSPVPTRELPVKAAEGLYIGHATADTIMQRIYDLPLRTPEYRYSDLNFAVLARALSNMEGARPLDELVETRIYAPLGADRTLYRPLDEGIRPEEIAPTEKDPFLRKQHLRGYVHDELAAFTGGVAGNAGLFSTADDLAKLGQTWLNGGTYGGERLFKATTVRTFTDTRSADGKRALGFDTAPGASALGSAASYGHTGFTGTQIKIDPERGLMLVFLCNRVNPSRENAAFKRSDIRNRLWAALFE